MNRVELHEVSKSYDGVVRALDGVTLDVREGELLAILGPSGCGKTTLLRALAGLEHIDGGEITLAGVRVAGRGVHVPAHRRRAALVPQDPALFPHLSVAANVGFGLSRPTPWQRGSSSSRGGSSSSRGGSSSSRRGSSSSRRGSSSSRGTSERVETTNDRVDTTPTRWSSSSRGTSERVETTNDRVDTTPDRVTEVLDLVGLTGLGDRMPHELSGGQQQRVSVARALAPRPALVLLDEPFSALDASLRASLRSQVKAALRADGATGVLVTHDQGEALAMADRIAVLREGRLLQLGTPHDVYHAPATAWVAHFVGEANVWALADGPHPDRTPALARTPLGQVPVTPRPDAASVLVRPEQVLLGREGVEAVVRSVDFHGHDALVSLDLADGGPVLARVATHAPVPEVGSTVGVQVSGWGHLLPDV